MALSRQQRAELLLISVTAIWGSTFVVGKVLLEENSPLFYSGTRFLASGLILLAIFRGRLVRIPRSTIVKGSILGIFLFIGFAFQTVGLKYTTASKSAFFTGLLVVLTPIVHAVVQRIFGLPRKILRLGNLIGVACVACGLYLLTSPAGAEFNYGDSLTLVCAFMFAFYIVYLDWASSEPDKLQLTYVQFIFCGLAGILTAVGFETIEVSWSARSVISFSYLAIFATIIAMWVQNRFQGETTPTRAAVIFSLEPVIAAVFGYLVRGENVGTAGVIGGAIMLAGVLLSEFSEGVPVLRMMLARGD